MPLAEKYLALAVEYDQQATAAIRKGDFEAGRSLIEMSTSCFADALAAEERGDCTSRMLATAELCYATASEAVGNDNPVLAGIYEKKGDEYLQKALTI